MNTEGAIIITNVETRENLIDFVKLPQKIYLNNPWWPGVDEDLELSLHDPDQNYALKHYVKTKLFLAVRDGEVVGRISATVNEVHNRLWNENIGFFGHFECIDDQEVANELLKVAEDWVRDQGKEKICGPFNYTYYGIIGLLIEGLDDRPTVDLAFNPEYYQLLIENADYELRKDLIEVLGSVDVFVQNAEERYENVRHLVDTGEMIVRNLDETRFKEDALAILDIYKESFTGWPFGLSGEEEWLEVFGALYTILPNELVFLVEDKERPIGFFFMEPDYNEVMHAERQGIQKEITRIKAFVIGIREQFQKLGISRILLQAAAEQLKDSKYTEISFSWIDRDNTKSVNVTKGLGGSKVKVFRLYSKSL